MPRRWFRIAYAANALRRALAEQGRTVEGMRPSQGVRAMLDFIDRYQPQHGDSDELWCSWGTRADRFEFVVSRRMQRHGHPDSAVSLVFEYRLTPARASMHGETRFDVLTGATATDGYRAIASATPLEVRLV